MLVLKRAPLDSSEVPGAAVPTAQAFVPDRWLQDGEKATLQELADEYGVSAERIRQVEANALKKMKALFAA